MDFKEVLITTMSKTISLLEDKITSLQDKVEDLELALTTALTTGINKCHIMENQNQLPKAFKITSRPYESPFVFSRSFINSNRKMKYQQNPKKDGNNNPTLKTVGQMISSEHRKDMDRQEHFLNVDTLLLETNYNEGSIKKPTPSINVKLKKNRNVVETTLFRPKITENAPTKMCFKPFSKVDVEEMSSMVTTSKNQTISVINNNKAINDCVSIRPMEIVREERNVKNNELDIAPLDVDNDNDKCVSDRHMEIVREEMNIKNVELQNVQLNIENNTSTDKQSQIANAKRSDDIQIDQINLTHLDRPKQRLLGKCVTKINSISAGSGHQLDTLTIDQLRELMIDEGIGSKLKMIWSPREMRDILSDHFRKKRQVQQIASRSQPPRKSKILGQKSKSS